MKLEPTDANRMLWKSDVTRTDKLYVTPHSPRSWVVGRIGVTFLLASVVLLAACGTSGPDSTSRTSAEFTTLGDRIDFLQRYVKFRRTYEMLDFAIRYSNHSGGMVPGPSEWDVRLVAVVPATEMTAWIPAGTPISILDADWLKSVPTSLDLAGIKEWYVNGQETVGVDRSKRIVVYRNTVN